jgi:hypothetical protein
MRSSLAFERDIAVAFLERGLAGEDLAMETTLAWASGEPRDLSGFVAVVVDGVH